MVREDVDYWIEDIALVLKCFFCGIASMFRRSTWSWMKETKDEHDFSWPSVIGIVFWTEHRQKRAWEKPDTY